MISNWTFNLKHFAVSTAGQKPLNLFIRKKCMKWQFTKQPWKNNLQSNHEKPKNNKIRELNISHYIVSQYILSSFWYFTHKNYFYFSCYIN